MVIKIRLKRDDISHKTHYNMSKIQNLKNQKIVINYGINNFGFFI
ncbi:MAG: hypothetical protein UZ05_CHB002000198 [Chlorobi bacterium OLB5]|nr:MAG: hypothetical protein UZ05_CHB002000198 [Chlorobi bacterium OLB5]